MADCSITIEEVKTYLGNLVNNVDDTKLQMLLDEAIASIPKPCNCNLKVVAWYIAKELFNLGLIGKSSNDLSGVKKYRSGKEEVEYAVSTTTVLTNSNFYKGVYDDALQECLSHNPDGNNGGSCGNIFIV
jgi:hypothetical protein